MNLTFDRDELLKKSKEELIDFFLEIILHLQRRIQELEAQLSKPKKTSKNSSMPPSSGYKPKKEPRRGSPKKPGPKPGHEAHHKTLVDDPDCIHESRLESCPECGRSLYSNSQQTVCRQWLELEEIRIKVHEEHRQFSTCSFCQKTVYAPSTVPDAPAAKQHIGPYLKTFVSLLQYQYGVSRNKLKDFISRFSPCTISSGSIDRIMKEASRATASYYDSLLAEVRKSEIIGVDETSWSVSGVNHWAWVFQNDTVSLYAIKPSRGSDVPKSVLGDTYEGVIVSDFYSSYSPVSASNKAKCNAHLIRDLIYGKELEEQQNLASGICGRLLDCVTQGLLLRRLKPNLYEYRYHELVNDLKDEVAHELRRDIIDAYGLRIQKRFRKYSDDIFRYLTEANVPPTNNGSENALRKLVIHRKRCHGSRSDSGALGFARMMSFIETAKKRGEDWVDQLYVLFKRPQEPIPDTS